MALAHWPKYPDLALGQFYVQLNHTAKTICVGVNIRNYGAATTESFKVVIGISVKNTYSEEIFTIPENTIIVGDFQSPCSQRELIYRNDDWGAVYTFYALLDSEYAVVDTNRANNYDEQTWWTYSPAMLKTTKPVRIEAETSADGVTRITKKPK